MNYKTLLKKAELNSIAKVNLQIASLLPEGNFLLQQLATRFSSSKVAIFKENIINETLEIASYPYASSCWYDDRNIKVLKWEGDLIIDGDLLDDDFSLFTILIVTGNLYVRHWLRGGMASFIGGNVQASGVITTHYNDAALFVGENLSAEGYIFHLKPYVDFPHIIPHQIAGNIHSKSFQIKYDETDDENLSKSFVEEVLDQDEEGIGLNNEKLFQQVNARQPIWK
jgi:hypothetical protein